MFFVPGGGNCCLQDVEREWTLSPRARKRRSGRRRTRPQAMLDVKFGEQGTPVPTKNLIVYHGGADQLELDRNESGQSAVWSGPPERAVYDGQRQAWSSMDRAGWIGIALRSGPGSASTSTIAGPRCSSAFAIASSSWPRSVTRIPRAPQFSRVLGEVGIGELRLPDVPLPRALLLGDLAQLAVVEQQMGDVHLVPDRGGHLRHVLAEAAVACHAPDRAAPAGSLPRPRSPPG